MKLRIRLYSKRSMRTREVIVEGQIYNLPKFLDRHRMQATMADVMTMAGKQKAYLYLGVNGKWQYRLATRTA